MQSINPIRTVLCASAAAASLCASAAVTYVNWSGADADDPRDLAVGANWEGDSVPELDTTVTPHNGPFARFEKSSENLSFTMGRDLFLNGLLFNCTGSTLDFDLSGRVVKLYGYTGDGQALLMRTYNGKSNNILFRGGTIDTSDRYSDKHPTLYGTGPVAFSGTSFPSLTLFSVYNKTHLYMTNGVTGKVYLEITGTETDQARVTIAGAATKIDAGEYPLYVGQTASKHSGELRIVDGATVTNAALEVGSYGFGGYCLVSNAAVSARLKGNYYFGLGINGVYASNNVFEVKGGSHIYLAGEGSKSQLNVGHLSCGNTMTISGAGTKLDWTASGGVASVTVGEFGDGNVLHITDGATVGAGGDGDGSIGNIASGYLRGDSNGNQLLVDGGASYKVSNQYISGRTSPRSGLKTYDRLQDGTAVSGGEYDYSYCSNRMVVSGAGTVATIANYMYVAAASTVSYDDNADYNLFRVESNATASCGLRLDIGGRGVSNGVEVASGATLTVGKYGFNIGAASGCTGTYVHVSGESSVQVTHTADSNGILSLCGSGEGGETTLDVSGGSTVSARSLSFTGAGNVVRLEDGSLSSALAMTCPGAGVSENAVRFEISGTNSQVLVQSGSMSFGAGVEFSFGVSSNAYLRAPFAAAASISFQAVPEVSFAGLGELSKNGGGKMTLFEAGTAIDASQSVVDAFDAAAKIACPGSWVRVVDGTKIVLRVPSENGIVLIVR
ncbi:MAG: hypothetical protein IJG84_06360 [Kiritimatiellae bacterium]|nr:hypothetical protein [Kiritimatiellia bacterium]